MVGNRRRGFTLVELLVAIALSGGVALMAHHVLVGVGRGVEGVVTARSDLDEGANAGRLLRQVIGSTDVGAQGRSEIHGTVNRLSLTTWDLDPGGWFGQRVITLERVDGTLVLTGLRSVPTVVRRGVTYVAFDYLYGVGEQQRWMKMWTGPVGAPIAIRVRVGGCGHADPHCADTLLVSVGTRG